MHTTVGDLSLSESKTIPHRKIRDIRMVFHFPSTQKDRIDYITDGRIYEQGGLCLFIVRKVCRWEIISGKWMGL